MARSKDEIVNAVAPLVESFLKIRVNQLQRNIAGVLNVNPFLLRAIEAITPMQTQSDLARFMWDWHVAIGYATAFAKAVDERILPAAFGTSKLDAYYRAENDMLSRGFDSVDHRVYRLDGSYLLSLKSSAWTIQHGQAMVMYSDFKEIASIARQETGIVVGVYYGSASDLTNKYEIVRGVNVRRQSQLTPLSYVSVLAGKEFWSWLNDDEPLTQEWLLAGIAEGADRYKVHYPDVAEWLSAGSQKLRDALRIRYSLPVDDTLDFYVLLHAVNDGQAVPAEELIEELPPGSELPREED